MLKRLRMIAPIMAILLMSGLAKAEATMTRIVYRYVSPQIAADSFAATPAAVLFRSTSRVRIATSPSNTTFTQQD